jgi:site-specific DNA recombinase
VAGRGGPSFISPDVQRDQIRRWAALRGAEIAVFHTDLDESGSRDDRPGLLAALERAESGLSDGLVVAKLDRFARSLVGALETIRRLEACGATFVSVAEGLDPTTSAGKMMTRLMLVLAEYELDRYRESWEESDRRAVARGIHVSSKVPTGYRRRPDRMLEPDPATAPAIARAFAMRAACHSYPEIGDELLRHGIGVSGGQAPWTAATLINLFRNPVYIGEARCGPHRRPGAHPAIVDRGTFELAQAAPRLARLRSEEWPSILSGLLRCAGCRYCMQLAGQRRREPRIKRIHCDPRARAFGCPEPAEALQQEVEALVERRFLASLDRPPLSPPPGAGEIAEAEARLGDAETRLEERLAASAGAPPSKRASSARERSAVAAARSTLLRLARSGSMPAADALREAWPAMGPPERRRHLAMALDAVFLRPGPGPGLDGRVLLVPFGRGPREIPRPGKSVAFEPFRW